MRFSSLTNGSPLSLLNIEPNLKYISFEGACKAWETQRLEPKSVLDLGSPSPSSRAVSSVSGSLDDRPTVSSSSLYEETEKKTQAGRDGGGYLGERTSSQWMAGKILKGEVPDTNYKETVQRLHGYSKTADWCAEHCQRSVAENEQIHHGEGIILPLLRTEQRPFFGISDKANVEAFQSPGPVACPNQSSLYYSGKQGESARGSGSILEESRHGSLSRSIFTGGRNPSVDPAGYNHNFITGEGFGSAAISSALNYNSASESLCGLSVRGENIGEWRSEEARNNGLDDMLADLGGYSEFPLREDLVEAVHCGMVNPDNVSFNSAVPVPDQSIMRWLIAENDHVQNIEESLCGLVDNAGLGSKLHLQLQDRTPESTSQLLSPKALVPTPIQTACNLKGAFTLQSAFSSLETASTSPALVQLSAFPKFPETSLSDFCHSTDCSSEALLSSDNTLSNTLALPSLNNFQEKNIQSCFPFPSIQYRQDVASKNLGLQVKHMSHSGVPAFIAHSQIMSSSPDICVNLFDPLLSQDTQISQNILADGSSDQIYTISSIIKQHPFQLPSLPSLQASQPPVASYLFNSCQQTNPNTLQKTVSGQLEIPGLYQLAGWKSKHESSSLSVGPKLQSEDYVGTDSDEGPIWHTKVQMDLKQEENLRGLKHHSFQVGASHRSSMDFSLGHRKELQAHRFHNAAQEPTGNADEGVVLVNQLFQLVEALDRGDLGVARLILARLNQYPLSQNKYVQRVVLYFRDALATRLMNIYQSSCQTPSPVEFLQKVAAHCRFCEASPYLSFAHFMANQAILEALEGEENVHVIDFEISFGGQWASFLQDFASKPENGRRLRITAVGCRQDEMYFAGERLSSFAKDHNILLDFQVVVTKLESLTLEMLQLRLKESIAVNFVLGQHKMLGDSPNSIDSMLKIVKGLSPKIVTVVEKELDDNSPNLQARFLETLSYYFSLSDLLGDGGLDHGSVMLIEELLFMPEILDTVICKRLARGGQNKVFQRWRQRFLSAGFSNIPFSNLAETNAQYLIRRNSTFQGYNIVKNEGSILLGWRGKSLLAASAWTLLNIPSNSA